MAESPGILILDMETGPGRDWFDGREGDVLECLNVVYGARSVGSRLLSDRIRNRRTLLLVAEQAGEIVAVSYVHRNGRRGALTVREPYRGRGLASALIVASLAEIPDQYTELPADNDRLVRLYLAHGFRVVSELSRARRRLGEASSLIRRVSETSGRLAYLRQGLDDPTRIFWYVMLETHGGGRSCSHRSRRR